MNTKIFSRQLNRALFQLKKHSPEILMVAGAVGTVAATVMACKATTKLPEKLEEAKETLDAIHDIAEDEELSKDYPVETQRKDLFMTYVKVGYEVGKLYAPAVIIGSLSLSSMFAAHNVMRKRNVALAAAYATIDKGFKEYRGRVIERFGEGLDDELRYGFKSKEVKEKITDEDGKEKTVKTTRYEVDPSNITGYSRFLEVGKGCFKDPDRQYNMMFLKSQQNYWNNILQARGYVFLNEVYRSLEIDEIEDGQVIGWYYDPSDETRQNYIDFGLFKYAQNHMDFIDGEEDYIFVDFNVHGNIMNDVYGKKKRRK